MEILKSAIAGTTESSDVQITIIPNAGNGIEITLKSVVQAQFGDSILGTINALIEQYEIKEANIQIDDKGAFDWVIQSRFQTALFRAAGQKFDWKEAELNA